MSVSLPEHMPGLAREAARDWRVLAAARPLVIHGDFVGMLYIGMDVTSFFRRVPLAAYCAHRFGRFVSRRRRGAQLLYVQACARTD